MTRDRSSSARRKATFTEPAPFGYVYVGLRVAPPAVPFVRANARRQKVLQRCAALAVSLEKRPDVVAVTVHEACVIPPVRNSPRFDVICLVETTSPATASAVEALDEFETLARRAELVMPAINVRRIGEIGRHRSGYVLFNHFTTADPDRAVGTLEDVASWFVRETGVNDSELLRPVGDSPYAYVTHIGLPVGPLPFLARCARPGFWRFVVQRLRDDGIGFAPIICRIV
jgi:hypothetical protein